MVFEGYRLSVGVRGSVSGVQSIWLHLLSVLMTSHSLSLSFLLSLSLSSDATPKAVCHFNGKTYMDEERWDIDSCTHCYCLQGQTLCSTVSCPALPCHQPIIAEGSCCPMCPGKTFGFSEVRCAI